VFQYENSLVYEYRIKILHYGVCLKLNITPLCCVFKNKYITQLCCVFQYENSLVYEYRIKILHYGVCLKLNITPLCCMF
jgi:hypothetical protein